MKSQTLFLFATAFVASTTLMAEDSAATHDVKAAADKLAAADNYSWTTTTESSSQFKPGPSHGKTEKGGYTWVDFSFQDNKVEAIVKDGKGAIKTEDGWESLVDATKDDGGGGGFNMKRMMARRMQSFKTPAAQAGEAAGQVKELSKADDVYSGDLTEEGAKNLFTFGGRRGGGPGPTNVKGSAKFWVKDGALTKFEYKVSGTVNFNGDDNTIDRTTTVEIKDVGSTKVTVPDEAKAKLTEKSSS